MALTAHHDKDVIVSFLLQRDADPNCLDNGKFYGGKATAIDYAVLTFDEMKRDRGWCTPDAAHVTGVKRCIKPLKAADAKETNVPKESHSKTEAIRRMMGGRGVMGGYIDDHDSDEDIG